MKTNRTNLRLSETLADEALAILKANPKARVPASHDLKMRICWATEEFLRTAKSTVQGLQQAIERLEATTSFADPRSAAAWVIGLDDLQRRRAEIESLTTALEIVENAEARATEAR